MGYNTYWQRSHEMKRKRDRDRLSRALTQLKQKRGSMDLVEKGARLVGSVGGFVLGTATTGIGGAAGAAGGNALMGGLFDVADKSQEAQLKDIGFHSELGDTQWQGEVADIDAWTKQQNMMAQTRHITEPAKAFMTGMKVAEAGTVASAAGGAEVGTKVAESGGEEIVKEGVKKAGEEASQNAIKTATKEGVKKGWKDMTYLEKATHNPFAGKSLEQNFGTIKKAIGQSQLGQLLSKKHKDPSVVAKTGLDTAVNSELAADNIKGNLLDNSIIKDLADKGYTQEYSNVTDYVKDATRIKGVKDAAVKDQMLKINEELFGNKDFIGGEYDRMVGKYGQERFDELQELGAFEGMFDQHVDDKYYETLININGNLVDPNTKEIIEEGVGGKLPLEGFNKQAAIIPSAGPTPNKAYTTTPKVTVGDPMGPKTYGKTGLIDPYWDPATPSHYVQDAGGNWVPPEIKAGRKGKLSGMGRLDINEVNDRWGSKIDTTTVIPKQSMGDMLSNPNMTSEDIFKSMGQTYNKSGGNSITEAVEILDTSMSVPSVDNIVKETEVVNTQIKSSIGTNEERFSGIMDAMKIQEGGSPDSVTAELSRPLPGGGFDTAKGTYQIRDIWAEEYKKLFPADKDLDLKGNEQHQRKALGKWLEHMIDQKGYTKEQAVAAYNAGETGMKQGFGDAYADSVFTTVQDTTLGEQNVFEPPMMDEIVVTPDNTTTTGGDVFSNMDENTRTAYDQLLAVDKDQVWPYQGSGDMNNIPFLKDQGPMPNIDPMSRFNETYYT